VLLSASPARAGSVEALLAGAPPREESALVAELLARTSENKARHDAERRDYSRQYSGYFDVLKATSSYVPKSDDERRRLGYSKPAECGASARQRQAQASRLR